MPPPSVRFVKRGIDVAAGLLGLGLTLPAYPVIALAIRLESPGPIFYRQRRAGVLKKLHRNGLECTEFQILKFRTMTVDAENGTGPVVATPADVRVTRVGSFLRRTRMDEMPQFINVLLGDMSIVGPRPERPELLHQLALAIPFFEERVRDVKPGITGLAQVSLGYTGALPPESLLEKFRSSLQNPFDIPETEGALADDMRIKLLYDMAYSAALERFSTFLRTEVAVILQTPLVMLRGAGI